MGSGYFTATHAADGGGAVVRLVGELDPLGAQVLTEAVSDLSFDGVREVRVDCSELTFLDSTGIASLLDLRNRASDAGAWFALDRVPAAQRRILEIAGLADILQIESQEP